MTNERPYRAALPMETALAQVSEGAGTQFDPGIVAAFTEEIGAISLIEVAAPALAS